KELSHYSKLHAQGGQWLENFLSFFLAPVSFFNHSNNRRTCLCLNNPNLLPSRRLCFANAQLPPSLTLLLLSWLSVLLLSPLNKSRNFSKLTTLHVH
ncbi:MAG: hypothetical protein EXX96DRAFT_647270, partial [Benjaminiella poitrasii]